MRFLRRSKSISAAARLPLLLIVLALAATFCSAAVLGSRTASSTTKLTQGGAAMTTDIWSGTYAQSEHYLSYAPGSDVLPKLAYGNTLYGRSDLSYVAGWVRGQNLQAVAGINASFFDFSSGLPTGPEVTDGVVRETNAAFSGWCVGFFADGSAQIGQPVIQLRVRWPSDAVSGCHYNRVLSTGGGLVLYSRDFDTKTKNTLNAWNLVLQPETDRVTLGCEIRATVRGVTDARSCDIPEGCFVLSVARDSQYQSLVQRVREVQVGDTLTFTAECPEEWLDCVDIVSAGDLLVQDGAALDDFTLDSADRNAARTALGIRADGSVLLYTVDSGSAASAGLTLPQLAKRMLELGCVQAVNLDGGGSTTLGTVSNAGTVRIQNRPSDGAQRKCANYLFLYYDIQHILATPADAVVLPGARTAIRVTGVSGSGHQTPAPPQLTLAPDAGSAAGTVFIAPQEAGTVQVAVRSGEMRAATSVRVAYPDAIVLRDAATGELVEALTLDTNDSIDLNAAGLLNGTALPGQDDSFRWSVTGGIGTITPAGVFTAIGTPEDLFGSIVVVCGDAALEIPVLVEGGVENAHAVWTMDDALPRSGTGLTVTAERTRVCYGTGSAALTYNFAAATGSGARQVRCDAALALDDTARHLGFWLYGDGSGNSFSVRVEQGGITQSIWAVTMKETGWRYVAVDLPAGEKLLSGFAVTQTGSAATGTVYLDQVSVSRFRFTDAAPPVIAAQVSGGMLTVSVTDAGCEVASVTVTCDGEPLALSAAGTAALPRDGQLHQLQIRASDAVGNLSSRTITVSGEIAQPFADMGGHWAAQAVGCMAREGVLGGSTDRDGRRIFRPNDPMSRQEFIKAVAAWCIGGEPDGFSGVELPFADQDQISGWALPYVRAAYAMGLVGGSRGADGKLYLQPGAPISRQEAMVILNRTQPKGYAAASLSGFSDAAKVAGWAKADIAAMVGRGVISGSGGKLDPTGPVTRAQVAKMLFALY